MMSSLSLSSKSETIANLATTVVAVLISAVLVKTYFLPASSPRVASIPQATSVGANLKSQIPGVDWKANGRTLVLAISTQCHFCTESAPFYRKVRQEVGKNVKIVAVLPQTIDQGKQYLETGGVAVDQIKQASLASVGVQGTPTMFLVNNSGVVTKVWVGKLDSQGENQVITELRSGHS